MAHSSSPLQFKIDNSTPNVCSATVTISKELVNKVYQEATYAQQKKVDIPGFHKGTAPLEYVAENYRPNLTEHLKEVLFHYFVINFLYDELHGHKLPIAGEPRIYEINLEPDSDATFIFELSLTQPVDFHEWKHFAFKAPKRKNYKDIDRQVDSFIKDELEKLDAYDSKKITAGDWICFDLCLVNSNNKPVLSNATENVWLKIGNEEADTEFAELFADKSIGDSFTTRAECMQDYFGHQVDTDYLFRVDVLETVPYHYFCFEEFKHHFRIKSNKEMHKKLIEVFSYRNDISQRRATAEDALKLLLAKHQVDVPNYLILRQQKLVLEAVQTNPDYQVYKTQAGFKESIRKLAAKQAREMVLIDQLAHKENIKVSNKDVCTYLNLTKRPRVKEFIYFSVPPTKINGQEVPLPSGILKKSCLREKTLNHIIYHLTRK